MKIAKKIIILLLVIALSLGMAACTDKGKNAATAMNGTSTNTDDAVQNTDDNSGENTESPENDGASVSDSSSSEKQTGETKEGSKTKKSSKVLKSPSKVKEPSNAPPKGEDRTINGLPKLIDVRVKDDGDLLALVNKYHSVSSDYRPKDMVSIDPKLGTWSDMELKKEAYEAYLKMYKAAKKLGYNLKICSAYRSYNTQVYLFNNSLAAYGWKKTYVRSAYPGRSEHHTGLAIDITSASMGWGLAQDFADYEDGRWLSENCHKYGYILRYPKGSKKITGYMYEPWHFRYVGKEVAKEIMESGLTLEEYLESLEEDE